MSEEVTPEQNDNQGTEQPAVSFTLTDLVMLAQVLQVVVQRGAIKADEMTTVGGLYDRLFKFLESQGAITKQQSADAQETTESATDPE